MAALPRSNPVPFPFILDLLLPMEPVVRPMFGCQAIYRDRTILLVMRRRAEHPEANGVWLATSKEHHSSLKEDLPGLRSVYLLSGGKSETNWQMLSSDADDFEEAATRLCALILAGDPRIGRIVPPRKKRTPGKTPGAKQERG